MELKELRKILGDRIRQERLLRNMTIEQFSEVVDISPVYLGLVERGERSLSLQKFYAVSKALGMDIPLLGLNITGEDARYKAIYSLLHNVNDDDFTLILDVVKAVKKSIYNKKKKE